MKSPQLAPKQYRFLLTSLLLYFSVLNIVFSQANDVTECPYFNVFSPDTTGVNFSLVATDINATISGVIANVVVEQTYYNAGDATIDATYVFPMSSNAAIYAMEMIINQKIIKAQIKRKDEAQTIFENADEAGMTAALLEQERPNVFQMSLANINSGDTLKVRMVYTELLVPTKGIYQFVFPNIVGPRFTTNGEPWVYQTIRDSLPLSETGLRINLRINAGMPVSATSKSHAVIFDYEGYSAQTILNTNPGADFIVDYTLDDNQIQSGLLLYEGEAENFFLSMIQPSKPDVPFESPKREYIFIMDISGSMRGTPLEISKQLIYNLLTGLNQEDRFNILFFAGGSAVLSPNSLAVTNDNIGKALEMLDNINAGGGTQLLPAIQRALDMTGTADYSRTFAILTDGYVTVEKEAFDLIRQNLNEANFFSFGIGRAVNRYIIDGMAFVGEGEAFVATDFMDADETANTFKEYIERPVLTNIKTSFEGIDVYDIEPLSVPDVFAERPIIIYGKYRKPAEGNLTITGDYANGVITNSLSFSDYSVNAKENIALKYLWARKRIKLMSDYGIASNETDTISIAEEITQLGLRYSLITKYTSFVAVDSSALTNLDSDPQEVFEEEDGSVLVDINDLFINANPDKNFLKILGSNIGAEGLLKFKLENLNPSDYKDLSIHITSVNGYTLKKHRLNLIAAGNIVTIPLGQLSSGIYFVTLLSNVQLLDTEKIMVIN